MHRFAPDGVRSRSAGGNVDRVLSRLRVDAAPDVALDVDAAPRADVLAALVPAGLFAVAAVSGAALGVTGHPVGAGAAPVFANWLPHVGPGTPVALTVAAAVVWRGPRLAARLRWPALLAGGYAAAVAWILGLALVDGWQRGLAGRLTTRHEYLTEVAGVTDVPAMVRGFTDRILDLQPDSWTTHVAGHPPGALLVFVALGRIGLGGGGWAALVCVLAGASVAVSVPVTVRVLGSEAAARAAVPFVALLPGAVWIGASADGLFAGVTAAGVALAAVAARGGRIGAGLLGGALLGFGVYLSYGLVLVAPIVLAALVVAGRARLLRTLTGVTIGAAGVAAAFTAAGFWWLDGYHLVVERYYQGIASDRPYAYWVWANLAAVTVCAGPAATVLVRRALVGIRHAGIRLVPLAALATMLAADVSGLSKAEVERIWLPFAIWLLAGAALIPERHRRPWLAVQAATALLVNHLLLTAW
jgi:methylthioxylose transferase